MGDIGAECVTSQSQACVTRAARRGCRSDTRGPRVDDRFVFGQQIDEECPEAAGFQGGGDGAVRN